MHSAHAPSLRFFPLSARCFQRDPKRRGFGRRPEIRPSSASSYPPWLRLLFPLASGAPPSSLPSFLPSAAPPPEPPFARPFGLPASFPQAAGAPRPFPRHFWSPRQLELFPPPAAFPVFVELGFGPFRQHLVNSSWAAVKELSKLGLGDEINLHIAELPAVYQKAKELVCEIWATRQPHFVVHVGLASASKATIILEQCGKNKGYKDRDACGFLPEDGCCVSEGPEKIESTINMKRVWKNLLAEGIDAIFSRDAGRYVCDYTYYASLYYGNGRAAFIHVPPLSKWVTTEFLGKALQRVILEILKQCMWKSREQSKKEPSEGEQENPWKK